MLSLVANFTTQNRIPKEVRENYSLKELYDFVSTICVEQVTNSHMLNFISLVKSHFEQVSKTVTKIEFVGIKKTGDLEIGHDSHSYIANGISVHNTINLPHEYTFDNFQNIYLDAYKSGHVKGVTTYRAGTMTSVLSSKENASNGYDEEVILDHVKMNNSTDATMKVLQAEGRKWYMTVVWNETKTRPFALFVQTNHHEKTVTTYDAIEKLIQLGEDKKIPQQFVDDAKQKIDGDSNATKITRIISLLLRHGVAIKNIVSTLDKVDNVFVGSFLFQIKKYLASFIKDGEKVDTEKCLGCGSDQVVYREGCKVCITCGSSKCG